MEISLNKSADGRSNREVCTFHGEVPKFLKMRPPNPTKADPAADSMTPKPKVGAKSYDREYWDRIKVILERYKPFFEIAQRIRSKRVSEG